MEDLDKKISSDPLNKKIFKFAQGSSVNLFLVGGYIRDLFLGIEKNDRDFAIEGSGARELAKKLAVLLAGSFVDLDKDRDMARVVIKGTILDFSGTLGRTIEQDLARRDYTINSIAWSPINGLIDPLNGIGDIEKRIIRAIKKENLKEDPIRILRAYRIASELRMDIEPETSEMITEFSHLLPTVSGERISSELFKILDSSKSFDYLLEASRSGVIAAIFPELFEGKTIPRVVNYNLNLIYPSLETVRFLEMLVIKLPAWIINHLSEEISGGVSRFSALKLGGFLHNIGKPTKITKHEKADVKIIENITKRLKMSTNISKMLRILLRDYHKPIQLIEPGFPEKRKILGLFMSLNRYSIDVTVLAMADILSMSGADKVKEERIEKLFEILEMYKKFEKINAEANKIINGNEIMEILEVGPGPEIGEIITELREAMFSGEVRNKEEAKELVKRINYNLT